MAFVELDLAMNWARTIWPQDDPKATRSIYALVDPEDGLVRYVGMTRQRLDLRLDAHLTQPTNQNMAFWLVRLTRSGKRPLIIRLQGATDRNWAKQERAWIAWFRAHGDLLNVEAGGPGWEERRRMGRKLKGRIEVAARSGPVRRLADEDIARLYPDQKLSELRNYQAPRLPAVDPMVRRRNRAVQS